MKVELATTLLLLVVSGTHHLQFPVVSYLTNPISSGPSNLGLFLKLHPDKQVHTQSTENPNLTMT